MLSWDEILCDTRIRPSSVNNTGSRIVRNQFEADYDRIVGSSSVRRLQDKAQVYPLQENDFTRTRLTHSIEVSALARSLGKGVGEWLVKEKPDVFNLEMVDKLAAILQTAGLVHDLGNPPFGHYGESVIREWFERNFYSLDAKFGVYLDKPELKETLRDYRYFDGNVQNFRILTKLQMMNDQYGANFTYGTLSSIIKYPWSSSLCNREKSKYGYFVSEADLYNKIRVKIGLKENQRNPITYLLEAADDIIYILDDIEDGVKKGYIDWNREYENIKDKCNNGKKKHIFDKIDALRSKHNLDLEKNKDDGVVRSFRNYSQSYLFEVALGNFIDNYDAIMTGTFEGELLDRENDFIKEIKKVTRDYCYNCHEVLALEAMSHIVLSKLLDIFIGTFLAADRKELADTRTYTGKIYRLISPNYRYISRFNYETNEESLVDIEKISDESLIRLSVDFIVGMTDSYAMKMYKELTGIKLPS
ncbi:dGTP triphosphohydrolase [Oribacterium sp. FC2011]|uniref:dGTP triphosphohydrolase n=1 Tax=Oribacterium sp. FC2011 TaxID=1408311 RepID=UPI0004E0F9BF|nr:dNTP triphosphohydrolase [Oribacterium sp. FC2011]